MIIRFYKKFRSIISERYALKFINCLYQRILLIDDNCPYSKNYTSRVLCGEMLHIENNSTSVLNSLAVSGGCYIQACAGINIGEGTIWSFNVKMISLDHDFYDLNESISNGPIVIGKNCWIGAGAAILSGVKLGDRTIVGANSVVNKSFTMGNVVIAGVPARIIREL